MRQIQGVDFTESELFETERELISAIDSMTDDKEAKRRLANIIATRFRFVRSVIRAENWLQNNGYAEIVRDAN